VVMKRMSLVNEITEKDRRLPTSQKIKWCITVINSLDSNELDDLLSLLNESKRLLAARNEVIHGRIYAGNDRCDELRSGREGMPNREITADELYDIAELLSGLPAAVQNINYFASMRAIAEKSNTP
jgi:hypothetical protein